jgi:Ribbon-helix-helix protein, copG family
MTVSLSFQADDKLAAALESEAALSGKSASELMERAVRDLLYRLACERDAEIYARIPLTSEEMTPWPSQVWAKDETDWNAVFRE